LREEISASLEPAQIPHAHRAAPLHLAERQHAAAFTWHGSGEHADINLDLRPVRRIGDHARADFARRLVVGYV
jgi:hypothetical protein